MRPDPDLTVSEWADQHCWLTSRASVTGPGRAQPGRSRRAGPRRACRSARPLSAGLAAAHAWNGMLGFALVHWPASGA